MFAAPGHRQWRPNSGELDKFFCCTFLFNVFGLDRAQNTKMVRNLTLSKLIENILFLLSHADFRKL